ncbi:hypothetical protein KCU98_g6063, partial [Aureobasidium melanogenum]
MTDQTPYALTISEILREVLEHLEFNLKALCSAIRVNRAWSEEGLDILWRSPVEDCSELLASLPEHRRQFYADRICCWILDKNPWKYQNCMLDLEFPRLRRLDLWLAEDSLYFDYQLVPTLEEFRLYNFIPEAEEYLQQLPEYCPNLRKFCVGPSPVRRLEFDQLEIYLKELPKLRALDLNGMSDDTMTDKVFLHLASLPLWELRMQKPVTSEMIDLACERLGSGNLFFNVHFVELKMEWCAAAKLIPNLTTLRKLRLDLVSQDTNYRSFQAIGTLTELRDLHLTIAYQTQRSLSREEILAIGQLHKLRNLKILGGGALTLDESVANNDLVSFLSSFPAAEYIYIDAFRSGLIPSQATIALATTSTRLESYTFLANWDLGFAESSTPPLFPKLQTMFYQHLRYQNIPVEGSEARTQKVTELAEAILKQCPSLKDFRSWNTVGKDKFTSELGEAVWHLLYPLLYKS